MNSLSSTFWSTKNGRVEDSDFAHFFEDGTKVKITSKIKPHLGKLILKFGHHVRGHTLITLAHEGTYLVCKMLTTVM